jgi:Protein of unknown function (DUF664)
MPGSPADPAEPAEGGEPAADGPVAVSVADYLWFADEALGQMVGIVEELGDDLVNRRPPFRDANSPYAILTHCLGVMEYWGGATVAERPVQRDRAAEFAATGEVSALVRRTEQARRRLREDIVGLEAGARPAKVWHDPADPERVPYAESKGAVLLHIMEELFQHLGQMELTRDVLVTDRRR